MQFETGSFRDRNARVFYRDGEVYRALGPEALRNWEVLESTRFFREAQDAGRIVRTERVPAPERAAAAPEVDEWAGFLRHERIPFVSYPYEWTFGMLRDAGRLQLDLLSAALDEGMILKDSTPFNFQWRGARPAFIDIASFEVLEEGDAWAGYRQFCEMFLFPLMLQAYKGVPFQPWLRGDLEGIRAEALRELMSLRDILRRGVLKHVVLQAAAQRRLGDSQEDMRSALRESGFGVEMIRANVGQLRKLVDRLSWDPGESAWSGYTATRDHYDEESTERKVAFVERALERYRERESRRPRLVWDLGANTGEFSRLVAGHADYVVAMEADPVAAEHGYRELGAAGDELGAAGDELEDRILPLVVDLANPSPAQGFAGAERKTLADRGRPDVVLCLALVHHLVIGANVRLEALVQWLADLGGDLVIEFVLKSDPKVKGLLRNKDDDYTDYETGFFERCLSSRFEIVDREEIRSGTRVLYHARNAGRGGGSAHGGADPGRGNGDFQRRGADPAPDV